MSGHIEYTFHLNSGEKKVVKLSTMGPVAVEEAVRNGWRLVISFPSVIIDCMDVKHFEWELKQ